MMITVSQPSSISGWRYVITCPGILDSTITDVNEWLDTNGIPYVNVVARYWIEHEKDVNWFILRWS